MACSNRRNVRFSNLNLVRELAQKSADLLNVSQIIYKVYCDGVFIYKFAYDWKGHYVEIVHPSGYNTSGSVLQDIEHGESKFTKSKKLKVTKRDKPI